MNRIEATIIYSSIWVSPSSCLPRLMYVGDDQAVEHTMAAIREEIKPFMASDTWAVLCVDETQVRYEEEITRAWLPKGSKTILKLSRQQEGQHYFGGPQSKNRPPSFDSFRLARRQPYLPSTDLDQKKVSRQKNLYPLG